MAKEHNQYWLLYVTNDCVSKGKPQKLFCLAILVSILACLHFYLNVI